MKTGVIVGWVVAACFAVPFFCTTLLLIYLGDIWRWVAIGMNFAVLVVAVCYYVRFLSMPWDEIDAVRQQIERDKKD